MRLLVITHTFPPSRHANAKRPYYLVKGFLQAGWHVDVFTSLLGTAAGVGESVSHPALRVIRRANPVERFTEKCAGHPSIFRALSLAINGVMWPDECLLWALKAIGAARSATNYDRVLSFILPASVLLTGLPSRLVGRHWTFDLQESVTPFFREHPRRSPLQRLMLPMLCKLERRTLSKAGRVIFTAESNRQAYIRERLVPDAATTHIPYFYDAEEFRTPAETNNDLFQIVYFGVFDWRGARSPKIFLQSVAKFLKNKPEARPHTEFLFHGNWLAEHNTYLDQLQLRDVVSLQPPVPYAEYIRKLKQSPVLLLVVASAHKLFMPSKIVDYFGARRPILAFAPRESEMSRVLARAGMADYVCDEFDVDAGSVALERLWGRYQANTLTCDTDKTSYWSSEVQIPRYLDAVRGKSEMG